MEEKTININYVEATASTYDPEKSHNGGSYYQPSGIVVFKIDFSRVIVEVDDQSCGDFGRRVFYALYWKGGSYLFTDDRMNGSGFEDEEEASKLGRLLGVDVINLLENALYLVRQEAVIDIDDYDNYIEEEIKK